MSIYYLDLAKFVVSFVAFCIPGYLWTLVLFDRIAKLERIVYSIAFSIAIVPLTIFWLSFLGLGITPLSDAMVLVLLATVALTLWRLKKHRRGVSKDSRNAFEQSAGAA